MTVNSPCDSPARSAWSSRHVPTARVSDVVDAFAAGFVYGLFRESAVDECVHTGNVLAAHVLRGTGDWETLPHLEELGT